MLNGLLSTIAILIVCGTAFACYSVRKAQIALSELCTDLCRTGPGDKAIESVRRDLTLRVEKMEAHWDEMYAKFDRFQRSETQKQARSRRSAEEAVEPLEAPKELTQEEQRAELRKKIHSRH